MWGTFRTFFKKEEPRKPRERVSTPAQTEKKPEAAKGAAFDTVYDYLPKSGEQEECRKTLSKNSLQFVLLLGMEQILGRPVKENNYQTPIKEENLRLLLKVEELMKKQHAHTLTDQDMTHLRKSVKKLFLKELDTEYQDTKQNSPQVAEAQAQVIAIFKTADAAEKALLEKNTTPTPEQNKAIQEARQILLAVERDYVEHAEDEIKRHHENYAAKGTTLKMYYEKIGTRKPPEERRHRHSKVGYETDVLTPAPTPTLPEALRTKQTVIT